MSLSSRARALGASLSHSTVNTKPLATSFSAAEHSVLKVAIGGANTTGTGVAAHRSAKAAAASATGPSPTQLTRTAGHSVAAHVPSASSRKARSDTTVSSSAYRN